MGSGTNVAASVPEEAPLPMEDLPTDLPLQRSPRLHRVDMKFADEVRGRSMMIKRSNSNSSLNSLNSTASTVSNRLWAANKPTCELCDKGFGLFRRRHHCRACGCCCCDECSPFRVSLMDPLERPSRA